MVDMQRTLGKRFLLVTQNVDSLHSLAGSGGPGYVEIHGTLEQARCMACNSDPIPLPPGLVMAKDEKLTDAQCSQLKCQECGGWLRPHVLWFDESYDDRFFPLDGVFDAIKQANLVLTVGTSGGTNLPWLVAKAAKEAGSLLLDINPEPSPFVTQSDDTKAVAGGAEEVLPLLADCLQAA